MVITRDHPAVIDQVLVDSVRELIVIVSSRLEAYNQRRRYCLPLKQEVKVISQKAPIPRLGVTPGGRNLYH